MLDFLDNTDTQLPQKISSQDVISEVERLHSQDKGATFSLYFGNMARQNLYAISVYPERTEITEGSVIDAVTISGFIHRNQDLLSHPLASVGTWYDEQDDITYLDVTILLRNKYEAIELGTRYNQIAVYELGSAILIETSGTGEDIIDKPPIRNRMPPIVRGRATR